MVWPAAQIPKDAAQQGATIIQINPDETALDKLAHYNLQGRVMFCLDWFKPVNQRCKFHIRSIELVVSAYRAER